MVIRLVGLSHITVSNISFIYIILEEYYLVGCDASLSIFYVKEYALQETNQISLLGFLIGPVHSMYLRNVGKLLPDCTTSHPTR
jgi:hypothetical protein